MKIVEFEKTSTVNINEINNNSPVGILWDENGKKTIILKKSNKEYISTGIELEMESRWSKTSKKKYIEDVKMNYPGSIIYFFDSNKELLKWLIE